MAIIKKELRNERRIIDLTGPDGNAFALMGIARNWWKQMGYESETIELMLAEMMQSDYEQLIETFDKHFGSFCDLER